MEDINELILKRLDSLDAKLDEVRTQALPQMKVDVALLVDHSKTTSKLYSGIATVLAIAVSSLIGHVRK